MEEDTEIEGGISKVNAIPGWRTLRFNWHICPGLVKKQQPDLIILSGCMYLSCFKISLIGVCVEHDSWQYQPLQKWVNFIPVGLGSFLYAPIELWMNFLNILRAYIDWATCSGEHTSDLVSESDGEDWWYSQHGNEGRLNFFYYKLLSCSPLELGYSCSIWSFNTVSTIWKVFVLQDLIEKFQYANVSTHFAICLSFCLQYVCVKHPELWELRACNSLRVACM